MALLERGVREWGAVGLKLHPNAGFYPDDPVCYPLYRKCQDLGVPVVVHTGTNPPPLKGRYAQPIRVDAVAADFPDLPIVMVHSGYAWWPEAAAIAAVKPSVYLDLSGWPSSMGGEAGYYRAVRGVLDHIKPGRVMFGTDWPAFSAITPTVQCVEMLKDAPEKGAKYGLTFSADEMAEVLGGTAARFFRLPETAAGAAKTETA